MGIILAELLLQTSLLDHNDFDIRQVYEIISNSEVKSRELFSNLSKLELSMKWHCLLDILNSREDERISMEAKQFIKACLIPDSQLRLDFDDLLHHEWLRTSSIPPSVDERCDLDLLVFLHRLANSSIEKFLSENGLLISAPSILSIPLGLKGEFTIKSPYCLTPSQSRLFVLDLDEIEQRIEQLKDISYEIDKDCSNSVQPLRDSNYDYIDLPYCCKLPNMTCFSTQFYHQNPWALDVIEKGKNFSSALKQQDFNYQIARIHLFQHFILFYPQSRVEIIEQSKEDIPPFLRPKIWSMIVGIANYPLLQEDYGKYIKADIGTVLERQIAVDIPRCHQYNPLLSSPTGQEKMARILVAWIAANPTLKYWQGLDSIVAPLLVLNFEDESMVFGMLNVITRNFLPSFFLQGNNEAIHEYLLVFRKLTCFHDPQLGYHLFNIGFSPDLFAIPWLITLFTRLFILIA